MSKEASQAAKEGIDGQAEKRKKITRKRPSGNAKRTVSRDGGNSKGIKGKRKANTTTKKRVRAAPSSGKGKRKKPASQKRDKPTEKKRRTVSKGSTTGKTGKKRVIVTPTKEKKPTSQKRGKRDRKGAMRMLAYQNSTNPEDQLVERKTRMVRRITNVAKNIDPSMQIGSGAIGTIRLAVSSFDADVMKNASNFAIGANRTTVNANDILNSVASSQRMLEQVAPHTPRIYVSATSDGLRQISKTRPCVAT
jgi:histone H3/H4